VATSQEKQSGTVIQAWLPHPLDQELRKQAEAERRSLSSTIRLAIEDKLRADEERRPARRRSSDTALGATGREGLQPVFALRGRPGSLRAKKTEIFRWACELRFGASPPPAADRKASRDSAQPVIGPRRRARTRSGVDGPFEVSPLLLSRESRSHNPSLLLCARSAAPWDRPLPDSAQRRAPATSCDRSGLGGAAPPAVAVVTRALVLYRRRVRLRQPG